MGLDHRNIALVRGSFDYLRPRGAMLMDLFYANLFRQFPYIRPLFKHHEMGKQRLAFMGVLTFLVQRGDDASSRKVLADLGQQHKGLGVAAGHYPAVSEALLSAAAEVSGDLWTPEIHAAWSEFMAFVATAMLPPGPPTG